MAPHVGEFVVRLFHVEKERAAQQASIRDEMDTIFTFRKEVIEKLTVKFKDTDISCLDIPKIQDDLELLVQTAFPGTSKDLDREHRICRAGASLARISNSYREAQKGKPVNPEAVMEFQQIRQRLRGNAAAGTTFSEALSAEADQKCCDLLLEVIQRWCFATLKDTELNKTIAGWVSFKTPQKTDFSHLVQHETSERKGFTAWRGSLAEHRRRDGFALTDPRFTQRQVLYEVDHCIYCHDRDTDSCSKGMRTRRGGEYGDYKTNPLGAVIIGCPLEEKISEMHIVKRQGDNIAALALITIDNPMCPGTGHRICNDCMRGCIYLKTEPVNIPQIETNVLTDVLFMPWGFEIYSLLTRWNPLNIKWPHAMPYNGKKVLIVGLGPSGYTLAHYLSNEGFGITGIDALKIEDPPPELTGIDGRLPEPIRDFRELYEDLDKRLLTGFGGLRNTALRCAGIKIS
jgi:NADPH-dependent glutamate synthase beta chain and related oxidoreductases